MKRTLFLYSSVLALMLFTDVQSQQIDMSQVLYKPAPDTHDVCTINPTDHNAYFYLTPDESLLKLMNKSQGSI